MVVVGAIVAVIALYLAISAILGLLIWVAIIAVLALAVAAAIRLTRRPATVSVTDERVRNRTPKGHADCAGETLAVGDHVRAALGFDGPIELAFSRGVVVGLGRGKAHVRFDETPDQVHPVTAGALRRLA
jgi:hypothetical protein